MGFMSIEHLISSGRGGDCCTADDDDNMIDALIDCSPRNFTAFLLLS